LEEMEAVTWGNSCRCKERTTMLRIRRVRRICFQVEEAAARQLSSRTYKSLKIQHIANAIRCHTGNTVL